MSTVTTQAELDAALQRKDRFIDVRSAPELELTVRAYDSSTVRASKLVLSDAKVCGQGLHFSPHPFMATTYHPEATRWLACKVKVDECVELGNKIEAPRCKVLHEVDEDGRVIAAEVAA